MIRQTVGAIAVLLVTVGASGCRTCPPVRGDSMYELAAHLTKLSAAVEAEVRYGEAPQAISDDDLIVRASKDDPSLRAPFAGYALRVNREDGHAAVLVCTASRKVGLLEDAGCSSVMDAHLWQSSPQKPCEFTIRLRDVCAVGAPLAVPRM